MKLRYLLITLVGATALVAGCDRPEKPTADSLDTTAKQLQKVRTDTKVVAEDIKDYAYAQKTEFVAKMQVELDDINRELEQLAANIDKSSEAVQAEAKPKLEALRAQSANLTKQFDAAKNANETTWDEVKAGFKRSYSDLKDGFQQARQWLSEKIAP